MTILICFLPFLYTLMLNFINNIQRQLVINNNYHCISVSINDGLIEKGHVLQISGN